VVLPITREHGLTRLRRAGAPVPHAVRSAGTVRRPRQGRCQCGTVLPPVRDGCHRVLPSRVAEGARGPHIAERY
jgi:hypothetical protein